MKASPNEPLTLKKFIFRGVGKVTTVLSCCYVIVMSVMTSTRGTPKTK